jgi:hypothetical protein
MRKGPKDQNYVVDLCDEVLGEEALREHHFGWLRGDAGTTLPVDAYYPSARLVLEYRERQHDEPVAIFDKPDQLTVSGVHRGEQRRIYDERREELIPANGLRLVIIRPSDLDANSRGRLRRNVEQDRAAIRNLLS